MALAHEIVEIEKDATSFSRWFYGTAVLRRHPELWYTVGEVVGYLRLGHTWCSCLRCRDTCYVTTAGYRDVMVRYNAPHFCREAPCPSPMN